MPLLARETDLYPVDLLERDNLGAECGSRWWALYTRSRREKELMRQLTAKDIPFYGPVVASRTRSPAGRIRTAFLPLFSNYVFLYGDEEARYAAMTTNCISRWIPVSDGLQLTEDLRRVHALIVTGAPVTVESRLEAGARVRVRSGTLKGQEGIVVQRRGQKRLVVAVNFLQQGASVLLHDFEVEPIY